MMIHKLAEWRERVINENCNTGSNYNFRVIVVYSRDDSGYVINGSVEGSAGVYVSSQRQDKRVFKTLDTVKKSLSEVGINYFEVAG
tara:strand:- start:195 stop:452 length:258 start_codon:yes stop_codon:yes gene_type:complete